MVYVPTNWLNEQPPPIDETNLNKIEQGLVDAHAAALYARYLWGVLLPFQILSEGFAGLGRVWISPMDVPWPVTIDRIIYQVGIASNGNVRLGIYREGATADSPVGANLVAESASVAQAAINSLQMLTVPDTLLTPGQYFIGIQGDNVNGRFWASNDLSTSLAHRYDRGGGYGAFTDPCPATISVFAVGFFGLRIKENHAIMS